MALINPFNDDYLIYDLKKHKYYGTPKLLIDSGIDLTILDDYGDISPQTLPERFVKKASDMVYQCIFNRVGSHNRQIIQFILAKNSNIRENLKDWIIWQAEYLLSVGSIQLDSGVLLKSGRTMDYGNLRGSAAYSAEMIDDMRSIGILNRNFATTLKNIDYTENNY